MMGKDVFSRKDANGDGFVDQGEYLAFEAATPGGLKPDQAATMFVALDTSKNGKLTRMESRGLPHASNDDYVAEDKTAREDEFLAVDENEDGAIDAAEWADFQQIHSDFTF